MAVRDRPKPRGLAPTERPYRGQGPQAPAPASSGRARRRRGRGRPGRRPGQPPRDRTGPPDDAHRAPPRRSAARGRRARLSRHRRPAELHRDDGPQVGLARASAPAVGAGGVPMTQREELIDVSTRLALMRDDLVTAIAADRRRARRRRVRVAGSMVALLALGSTAALAAATGLFSPAPPAVQGIFDGLNDGSGPAVDASHAVQIGVVDDHIAYAAPTEDGGFCLYFAP